MVAGRATGRFIVKKTAGAVPFCVNSESDLKKLVSTALWLTSPTFIIVLLFNSQNCFTFFVNLLVSLFNQHFTISNTRHSYAKQIHSSDTHTRLHYTKHTHSHDSYVNSYYTFLAKICFVIFTQHVQSDALPSKIKLYFTDTVNFDIFGLFYLTLNNISYTIR